MTSPDNTRIKQAKLIYHQQARNEELVKVMKTFEYTLQLNKTLIYSYPKSGYSSEYSRQSNGQIVTCAVTTGGHIEPPSAVAPTSRECLLRSPGLHSHQEVGVGRMSLPNDHLRS